MGEFQLDTEMRRRRREQWKKEKTSSEGGCRTRKSCTRTNSVQWHSGHVATEEE